MQIKTTTKYYFNSTKMVKIRKTTVDKDEKKLQLSYIDGNIKRYRYFGKQLGSSSKCYTLNYHVT